MARKFVCPYHPAEKVWPERLPDGSILVICLVCGIIAMEE